MFNVVAKTKKKKKRARHCTTSSTSVHLHMEFISQTRLVLVLWEGSMVQMACSWWEVSKMFWLSVCRKWGELIGFGVVKVWHKAIVTCSML